MARGKFIVLEGGDGSGKTTVGERLKVEFPDIVYTQDPGGTQLGEKVRQLLMSEDVGQIDTHAEFLLFLAGRAQVIAEVIKPALESGKHVISNRFGLSTIAYQIYGRERPDLLPLYYAVAKEIEQGCSPDACIVLDIAPEIAYKRIHSRPEAPSRFDKEPLEYHARVREGLKKHANEFGKVFLIDAEKPLEKVWTEVLAAVQSIV